MYVINQWKQNPTKPTQLTPAQVTDKKAKKQTKTTAENNKKINKKQKNKLKKPTPKSKKQIKEHQQHKKIWQKIKRGCLNETSRAEIHRRCVAVLLYFSVPHQR